LKIEKIRVKFKEYQALPEPKRSKKLAELMTELESQYEVFMMRKDITPEIKSREEYKLYMEISKARNI